MSVINPAIPFATPHQPHASPPGDNYLNHSHGIKSWLLTLDHKRIGLMYMVSILAAFLLGGLFAMLLRTELLTPGPTFTFGEQGAAGAKVAMQFYNNMFTLHGAIMVFMFIIPAIPAILGNFMLPLMLGAKDVAFPRLNLASYYCWLGGGILFVYVLISGVVYTASHGNIRLPGGFGLDTGWTFYAPYSTSGAGSQGSVIAAVMGAFILGFSSILTGVNFIASIHTLRPKGMTWFRMPLFLWALYSTALIQILATPVLAITLLLLCAERTLGIGIFDPRLGGDPVLMQHFFWFYSHPAVYIMILPGMGVISEVISTYSRKHIFGYNFIALSSVAIALLGFLVWGHHMFVSGQSPLTNSIFSLLTFSVAIPSAVKVFNWLSTLYKGKVLINTPMMYGLGFIMLFTPGGLTGLFLGALATDIHLTDTYFIVAHFHYVMVGSMLFAFLAGMYHWWPKMTGKMFNDNFGRTAALVVFLGFNLTFFPQFIMGARGMPRRYATYPAQFQKFHVASTVGAYALGVGLFMVLGNWISSLRNGKKAPANPWGANTLEWHTTSPPPHDNFPVTPVVSDPYYLGDWVYDPATEGWVIPEDRKKLIPTRSAH